MSEIEQLKKELAYPKDIVIVTHRNPDGDAIGSSLGLFHFLKGMGHAVHMISPSEYPDFFDWMPEVSAFEIYDADPERVESLIQKAAFIFCLDFNALDRIDKVGELIDQQKKATRVMIDHHLYPDPFVDYMFSDPSASSTCEMVYDFILQMGKSAALNLTIAECLYTGILTDTGGFAYSTTPKLFRIAADLFERGVDNVEMQDKVFNNMSEKQLRLLGHCLTKRMEIFEEFNAGAITLTKEDYERFEIGRGDTEGVVNYLLKLRGLKLAAFIHEQPTITKISLRSKGDLNVQVMAREHFKGGGHKNASGGSSYSGLRGTLKKFRSILDQYKKELE